MTSGKISTKYLAGTYRGRYTDITEAFRIVNGYQQSTQKDSGNQQTMLNLCVIYDCLPAFLQAPKPLKT